MIVKYVKSLYLMVHNFVTKRILYTYSKEFPQKQRVPDSNKTPGTKVFPRSV